METQRRQVERKGGREEFDELRGAVFGGECGGARLTTEGQRVPMVVGVQPPPRSPRYGPSAPLRHTRHGGRDVQSREAPPPGAGAAAHGHGAPRPPRRPLPAGRAGAHAADPARPGRRGARQGPLARGDPAAAIRPLAPGTDALRPDPTMERQRRRTLLQRCGQWLREHVFLSKLLGDREQI
jgi:hypothetical protein